MPRESENEVQREMARIQSSREIPRTAAWERLVALSCWFILVLEDRGDPSMDDVAFQAFETGDDKLWYDHVLARDHLPWRHWRALGKAEDDTDFSEILTGEILPDLKHRFRGTGSPLALIPEALNHLPIPMLRTMLNAALEYDAESSQGGGDLPLDEMRNLWNIWEEKCDLSEMRMGALFSSTLSEFLINVLSPDRGESVYDPCAGVGNALAECADRDVQRLFGVEPNAAFAAVAAARVLLHSEQRIDMRCGSPLELPPPAGGCDCVIGNFPWGGKASDPVPDYPVATRSLELLVMQHALAALKPGGRAAFVLPQRFLFGSRADERLRELLLREYRVEAVVELPGNVYLPSSAIKGAVLFVRRAAPRNDVWFITGEQFSNAVDHRSYTGDDVDHEILMAALHARMGVGTSSELRAEIERLTQRAESTAFTKDCDPDAAEWLTENGRQLLDLGRHFLTPNEPPDRAGQFPALVPIATIQRRNWELLLKESEGDLLTQFFTELLAAVPQAHLTTLGQLGAIFAGVNYSRETMVDRKEHRRLSGRNGIGLVRVSDLGTPKPHDLGPAVVSTTGKVLTPEGVEGVAMGKFIQPGDVLLSIGGTVGKVAVTDRAQGESTRERLVASNGLAVLRIAEPVVCDLVAMLLLTEPYQQWMQAQTTGSTIRHLGIQRLRELRVPILPRAEALRLVEGIRPGQSAATMLALLATKPGYTEAIRLLSDSLEVRQFSRLPAEMPVEQGTEALRALHGFLQSRADRLNVRSDDPYLVWLGGLSRLTEALVEILEIPAGADRFTALQAWRSSMRERHSTFFKAYAQIRALAGSGTGVLPVGDVAQTLRGRLEAIYDRILGLTRNAELALLEQVCLSASIEPGIVAVGRTVELTIRVENTGALPLKRVTLDLPSDAAIGAPRPWPLMPAHGRHTWPMPWLPVRVGKHVFQIAWRALRLDEKPVSGVFELAVEVQSLRAEVKSRRLDVSPYVTGGSLSAKDHDKFFGRTDVLDEIRRSLRLTGPGTVLILDGVRRVGKTSVLKQLLAADALPGWLPVYYCLQGASGDEQAHGVPTREMFYEIAKELILAAHGAGCTMDVPDFRSVSPTDTTKQLRLDMRTTLRGKFNADPAPFELFEMVVTSVLDALGGRRLLLMLDEFDKVQVGIQSGVTNRNLPENFRELIHRHERVSAILTGSQLMKTLRREYFHPIFGIGKAIPIGALDRPSAQLLVTRPVQGTLTFSDAARDAIVDLCGCQPFLIQHLCSAVFDIAARGELESITSAHVEQAVSMWLERDQHFAIVLRSDVDDPRRQCVLFVIAELERRGVSVTFEVLRDALEERGLAGDSALTDHLQYLADATVVSCEGTDDLKVYRITIPLLARWLARQDAALYLARAQRFDEGRL